MRRAAAFVLIALLSLPAFAQVRPQPGTGDRRFQTVDYAPEQVVLLEVAAGYQLTVELGADERIENIAVGESSAWQVTPNRRGDHLFVKLLQPGVTTNMVVVTDVRHYAFELVPLYAPSPDMAYTVRFRHPDAPPAITATSEQMTTGTYWLSGAKALRPSRIGDDGERTYIEWPKERTLPAVYEIDDAGRETLVNGSMRDGLFVIDRVAPKLVFRRDRQVARARRVPAEEAR